MIIIKLVHHIIPQFKVHSRNLRLRMFLCSSSSVVGLWLRRLRRENCFQIFQILYNEEIRKDLQLTLTSWEKQQELSQWHLCKDNFTPFVGVKPKPCYLIWYKRPNWTSTQIFVSCIICTSTPPTTTPIKFAPQSRQIYDEKSHLATSSQHADCVCVCTSVYLTSLLPICWRSSCLSVKELRGRMFFSSSSLLLGRFPSLMFRVSRRRILMARAPGIETP